MTAHSSRSHSAAAMPLDLRLAVINRRVSASGSVAGTLADLVFGSPKRDDVAMLHHATRARVADAVRVRS